VKDAYLATFPGLKDMYGDMKSRAKNKEPIRTWGQREYYCEPPRIVEGRIREFDYKLVNVLIQGSAADCTKEALIRFFASMVKHKKVGVWYLLLQVHDEVVISVPKKDVALAMTLLREAMESVEFDVPMLSEGAWSSENWASMEDYDTKGEMVHAFAA
jgi:DNA polymerase I